MQLLIPTKLLASHVNPLAHNEIACGNMLSKGTNNDSSFLPKLYKPLANLPFACEPCRMAFLGPIIIVVIIPATIMVLPIIQPCFLSPSF